MIRTMAWLASALLPGAAASAPKPVAIPVTVAGSVEDHQSGRLIVLIERVNRGAKASGSIDFNAFAPTDATIAARDVTNLRPTEAATIDTETDAFPAPLSKLAPGLIIEQAGSGIQLIQRFE